MRQSLKVPDIAPDYQRLMTSDRITSRTRQALEARANFDDHGYKPVVLSSLAYASLEAIAIVVLPQGEIFGQRAINLAARLDARLDGPGDGWRFERLPPDRDAYESALCGLNNVCLTRYGARLQDVDPVSVQQLLQALIAGDISTASFDAAQLQQWFSDLCADCVQIFMSHPAVQAQLSIDALFTGGDADLRGFDLAISPHLEDWEPRICKTPEKSQ